MPEGVERMEQARPLIEAVVRWAEGLGMRFRGVRLRVRLVDRLDPHGCALGRTRRRAAAYGRKITRLRLDAVEVVRGLSPTHFQGVVAHELGHVWAAVHRRQWPAWIEEGFCEALAHRFYTDLGTPEAMALARAIEHNPDPVYGGGFRFVRGALGREGLEALLRGEGPFPSPSP